LLACSAVISLHFFLRFADAHTPFRPLVFGFSESLLSLAIDLL